MLTGIVLFSLLLQDAEAVVRYVNLAAAPPVDLPDRGADVSLSPCVLPFDSPAPASPDFCYPFPVDVKITAYKPGAGYTKASLVVRVTNHGKSPVTLPAGTAVKLAGGKASYLDFTVSLQNVTWAMGFGLAYGDTGVPLSLVTIQPGQSVEYEIPLDLNKLKRMVQLAPGSKVPVVVRLSSWKLEKRSDGTLAVASDRNPIPANAFSIPYPGPND